jgi:hypothetical protein
MPPLRTLFTRRTLHPDDVIPQVSDAELIEWGDHLLRVPSPSEPNHLRERRPDRPLRAAPAPARRRRAPIRAMPTVVD